MICESCRRDVDYVRSSFWHGEARICRECFAHWCDPDNDELPSADAASVGNYVRLRHGLPPLAAAAVILLLTTASAYATRHCLDYAEAARTWPTRMLVKDGDGCWTYDHHPPRVEVPVSMPETILARREPALMDRWSDADVLQVELRQLEPEIVSQGEPASAPDPLVSAGQFALFLSLVLATMSVMEVVTVRHATSARHRRALGREARR